MSPRIDGALHRTSDEFQGRWLQFPSRFDVESPAGTKSVLHHNTSPGDFHRFLLNRAEVERFRSQMEQLIGPAVGTPPFEMDYSIKP